MKIVQSLQLFFNSVNFVIPICCEYFLFTLTFLFQDDIHADIHPLLGTVSLNDGESYKEFDLFVMDDEVNSRNIFCPFYCFKKIKHLRKIYFFFIKLSFFNETFSY